tara:strand:- start:1715 stop:2734 length:1020 start_codon:yes stop_codon:yes gene_type:complete
MILILQSFLIILLTFLSLRFVIKKFEVLQSRFYNSHQKLIGKESVPLIGGIIFFIYILFNFSIIGFTLIFFSFLILVIGILSDINYLNSPNRRLILQLFIILIFLNFYEYRINDLRIDYFNQFFSSEYFKYFFTTICILILINGSNFIDGSNGLNLGYFFIVLSILQFLIFNKQISIDTDIVRIVLFGIFFLLILNFLNFLYLGDSGAYLVSFIVGSILIYIYQNNPNLSPYFIALLLWYPAFENLFSIIRKKINKINPVNPDTNHLHQLIFKFINNKKNFIKIYSNQITSLLILLYNFFIFFISINFITKTNYMILLIILNIIIYLGTYTFLKENLKK